VKVGLLGATHPHARAHLRTLELLEEVESIAVWDEGEVVLEVLKKENRPKLETTRTTMETILSRKDIPIVVSLAQNNRNPDWIIRAAGAGKHILVEKPVAATAHDLQRVVSVIRHAGVHLGVFYTWRHNPIARDIRAMIEHGALGRVMTVEARMVTSQVQFRDPTHWLFKKSSAGGGILSWLGCHWIDLIRFIIQDEVDSVAAMVGTLNGVAIDVEDTATVLMRMKSGALATLHAGYLLPVGEAGAYAYDTYLCFRGLKGVITWYPTDTEHRVVLESVAPGWRATPRRELKYTMAASEAYSGLYGQEFVRQFIFSAMRKDPSPHNGENALRVLQIIEAAYQSNAHGRFIKVEEKL
jgi:predicted dehydrogenase